MRWFSRIPPRPEEKTAFQIISQPLLEPPWEGYFILPTSAPTHKCFLGVLPLQGTDGIPGPALRPKTSPSTPKIKAPERAQVRKQTDMGKSPQCTHSAPDPRYPRSPVGPQWVSSFSQFPTREKRWEGVERKTPQMGSFVGVARGLLSACKRVRAALMGVQWLTTPLPLFSAPLSTRGCRHAWGRV